jgi:sigma-B regulation protein RsbU (phosphoserine phosphatase)
MSAPSATILLVASRGPGSALAAALCAAGYAVRQAATGREALRLAHEHPQLIVLDPPLPDMSGAELCRCLEDDPACAATPVLHLSDQPPPTHATGANGYLVRPVEPRTVVAQVRALLRLRRAQEELRDSEARLRDILDHAPVVVHVKDIEGRYLLVNRRWERCFGRFRAEVIGRHVREVFPAQAATLLENDRRVLKAGGPLEFEEVVPHPEGTHTYLSVKFPLYDVRGNAHAVCGVSTDITERKRWEKALGDSEALYHSLVEGLPVCILRKDRGGRFTFANSAFCQELGRPLEQVVGKTDRDFYPEPLASKYVADDRRVMETATTFEDVEDHQAAGGERTCVEVIKSPVRDAHGAVIGVQAVFWDVTARKRAEEDLARTAAEFRVARRIQQKLFPAAPPQVAGLEVGSAAYLFDVGGASYPADAIGGDYYDYLALPDGSLAVIVGDVSGHGIGPALLMAEARAYLRAFARTHADVSQVLALANHTLAQDVEGDRFITLVMARLDPQARTLRYASAGHTSGYVFDARGEVKWVLDSTGIPLGIQAGASFPSRGPMSLEAGDLVLLLTDGIVEARSPDGVPFGAGRTADLVRLYRKASARQIVDNLYHAVRAFAQGMPQIDDITATVVKVVPRP